MVGVIDLGNEKVESAHEVADRIRAALKHVPAERLVVAPDCGMKYLTRERRSASSRRSPKAPRSCVKS